MLTYLLLWKTLIIDLVSSVGAASILRLLGGIASTSPLSHFTSHLPFSSDLVMTPNTLSLTLLFLPGGGSNNLAVFDVIEDTSDPTRSVDGIAAAFLWRCVFLWSVRCAKNYIPVPTVTPVDLHVCLHVAKSTKKILFWVPKLRKKTSIILSSLNFI